MIHVIMPPYYMISGPIGTDKFVPAPDKFVRVIVINDDNNDLEILIIKL